LALIRNYSVDQSEEFEMRALWGWVATAVAAAAAAAALAVTFATPAVAQNGAKGGEWPTYGGDLGNTRYSPLDQINAGNFNNLEIAWRFKTDSLGPHPEYQYEATPLMIHGVLYSVAGSRRAIVALDAATGELLWVHSENEGERGAAAPRQLSGRGLAYWTDGKEERIIYVTPGYRMIALNAETGTPISTFGVNGVVDLKKDDDQDIDPMNPDIGLHATPKIVKNVVVIGAAHRSGGVPKSYKNVKGYVRGFDVKTGKRLWIFHTIPMPGEFGSDTYLNGSNVYTGNTGVWGEISADPDLGLVYLPVELGTGDYFGAHRPGNNLFGESIVAVDAETGKRKWYYQLVHHGIWDMDIPCAPILTDIVVDGKPIKALAQPTKQGILYVFDRETGKPVWPIVEKPAPQGTVPGEWYSPTQPMPTKPPAYERTDVTLDDLIDFTPELHKQAVDLVAKYQIGPIFTPPVVSKIDGPLATLTRSQAGTNWEGGSYDPEHHVVYVFSTGSIGSYGLVPPPRPDISDMEYIQGDARAGARTRAGAGSAPTARPAGGEEGGGGGLSIQGLPIYKPPYGRISAIDINKGEILWQVAHGETPDNVRNNPLLKGLNIPRTGRPGLIGTVVTKNLVIAGEGGFFTTPSGARGAMLRAYDKVTGKEVGAVYMPAPQSGNPMTYMLNGKQYVVVAISGGNYSGELLAFKLPDTGN
jgi:quinoprotein glucose dehydrogenase